MDLKRILLAAFWLLFAGITPILGQDINGTWHLNGYHIEVTADKPVSETESISGTVTINVGAGSVSFNTNLGNWTESDGLTQTDDTYRMVYPPDGDPEFIIAIRVIDEDTLSISTTDLWLDAKGFDIERTEGLVGVLTKEQIPAPDPNAWEGEFTAKGTMLKEVENDGDAVRLQNQDFEMPIEANPDGTSYNLIAEDGFADNMIPAGNSLRWSFNDTSDYILWSDSFITTHHVQTRDQVRVLQLGEGKLAFFLLYHLRAITESSDEYYDGIRFLSEFEHGSFILVPQITSSFEEAVAGAGLSGSEALPVAAPFNDGVANLLKYAFNMDFSGPDSRRLEYGAGGTAGLPAIELDDTGNEPELIIEFLRRKNSDLIYTPKFSSDLGDWTSVNGDETVGPIDEEWERVTVTQAAPETGTDRMFGKVEVELP